MRAIELKGNANVFVLQWCAPREARSRKKGEDKKRKKVAIAKAKKITAKQPTNSSYTRCPCCSKGGPQPFTQELPLSQQAKPLKLFYADRPLKAPIADKVLELGRERIDIGLLLKLAQLFETKIEGKRVTRSDDA